MSFVPQANARTHFLEHQWQPYPAFDRVRFEGYRVGRVVMKNLSSVVLDFSGPNEIAVESWCPMGTVPKGALPKPMDVVDLGDWIGVGPSGELVLFAPCLNSRVGLNSSDHERLRPQAVAWADFLIQIRQFFVSHRFLEMTTPTLALSPGTEPFLDPLSVDVEFGSQKQRKYLITSPEFHLKKALGAGVARVFEIAKCYRNREAGNHHRIEFHMLEWYRSFASLAEIADDVEALINVFQPRTKLKRVTMRELFRDLAGVGLDSSTTRAELVQAAQRIDVRVMPDDSFDDVFHRIFLERIEPRLDAYADGGPILVSEYPPSMAALARVGTDGFADRFEVYWRGLELCNAFHELNDPTENRKRFENDNREREKSGREPVPLDEELLRCFEQGIPPAGGIALGLERLFMALFEIEDIADVRPFA